MTVVFRLDRIKPIHEWICDYERRLCTVCTRMFTLLRRRHHCRICGDIACGDCIIKDYVNVRSLGRMQLKVCASCMLTASIGMHTRPAQQHLTPPQLMAYQADFSIIQPPLISPVCELTTVPEPPIDEPMKLCSVCEHPNKVQASICEVCGLGLEVDNASETLEKQLVQSLHHIHEAQLCPICWSAKKNIVFQCGHETCEDCSNQIKSCPICRASIEAKIRRYVHT